MKHLCFFICLGLWSLSSQAQTPKKFLNLGNVVSDSSTINPELGLKLGLGSIQASPNVIEVRLYSNIGFPGTQCVVLQYDKGWRALKYKLNEAGTVVKSVLKPAGGIDAVANAMIAHNVFALPTQAALNVSRYALSLPDQELTRVHMENSDMPCYFIQFKVSTASREYKYCDPKSNAAFFRGQHDYADMAAILKAFAKLEAR